MIKLSTGTAWGILCSVTLHAASSFTDDLPLTTLPATRLGPAEVQYVLDTPSSGGDQRPVRTDGFVIKDLPRDDFFGKFATPAPPVPAAAAYFGLITGEHSESSILSYDYPPVSKNGKESLANLAGVALYGFGVFAVYRGIRKASGEAES